MSGTALDHRLVRDYLRELDAAMRGLPAAQARELREQITAHLDDALGPGAGDEEVTATLRRLGPPADLAAEAGAASASRSAPDPRRARWRLAVLVAVPVVTAAVLGALRIGSDVGNVAAAGRDQRLVQLDAAVVTFTRDLEDERDLSGAYAARRQDRLAPIPVTLTRARTATDAAAAIVRADAAGIGAGYPPDAVRDLAAVLAGITDLRTTRASISSADVPPSQIIRIYTGNIIGPANTFSAAVGVVATSTHLQSAATTLAALLRVENDQSVQRAILYATLSAHPPVLRPEDLSTLQQAATQEHSDQVAFNASASPAEQQLYSNTVAGAAVDMASSQEIMAEQDAATHPQAPLTGNTGLTPATWYSGMSTTIDDTHEVADQLTSQLSGQASSLKSDASWSLLLTSIATLILLTLLFVAAVLARPLSK
ncbi:MAG: nitrate- and nitrite sensing domain-containing protein [Streptosporangiaceae bacterium]|jgi:hypothetical protein